MYSNINDTAYWLINYGDNISLVFYTNYSIQTLIMWHHCYLDRTIATKTEPIAT